MRRLFRLTGAMMGAGAFLWLIVVGLILLAGARPELQSADAIVVMGAAQYNGRPSPVLRARLDYAIELYEDDLAPLIVFTGGVGVGDTLSEAKVARRYAEQRGVPTADILIERHGRTSGVSVRAAAALLHARGLRTVLIVSDAFHMLRLELLARRAGLQPYRAPAPASPIKGASETFWRYVLRESVIIPLTALPGGR